MRIGVLYYIMHEVRWQHEIIMCCIVIVSCQTLIAFKVFFLQVAIYKLIAYSWVPVLYSKVILYSKAVFTKQSVWNAFLKAAVKAAEHKSIRT